ncbi:MAG: MFS transporter [Pseudomonadales bacterium]
MPAQSSRPPELPAARIPGGVWALGFVSLLMDVSSEMIHALLPVYLVVVLGSSMLTVGFIEGIAEATAAITKVFSGALSDRLRRRKTLVVVGYGLAALTKPVFALATTIDWLVGARFVDRIGKGIRGAPRDALIADLSPESIRGASFGLRQSLDTVGAFLGPLLAVGLMWWTLDDISMVFWFAAIPAALAVGLLLVGVREPERPDIEPHREPLFDRARLERLGSRFWWLAGFAGAFTLARFSEAFLILKAESVGLSLTLVPMVLVVMNVAYALAAYPAGVLSDRGDRIGMLVIGLVLLIAADVLLARSSGLIAVAMGVVLWGLHMGFTQGIVAALVADMVPGDLRGTGFGVLNLITGLMLLLASVLAGALWDAGGAGFTFTGGAVLALLSLLGLLLLRPQLRELQAAGRQ